MRKAAAILSGLLLWLSFPNPWAMGFEAWPGALAWISLVPLLLALPGQKPAAAFLTGWLAGLACFLPGLLWLTEVKPMGAAAWPAWAGLAAWCALFPAAFAAGAAWGLKRGLPQPLLWLPALWTLLEWLRGHLLSGFPWLGLGSSQFANPFLLPLAALTGEAGLHYAVALGNGVAAALLWRTQWLLPWRRALPVMAVLAALGLGARWQAREESRWEAAHPAPLLKVAVAQGGIDQDQAWDLAYRTRILDRYLGLSAEAAQRGSRLLLWPESSFPGFFNQASPERERLEAFAAQRSLHLLFGSTLSEGEGYRNGAVWLGPSAEARSYAKRHLVPFGEYVPLRRSLPFLDRALERLGVAGFEPGSGPQVFAVEGARVAPLICYESVFPDLARESEADLIAVLTVDTWYGRTPGPVWHASQAVLRAVENGCWVARSAATGISLLAGPEGRLRGRLDLGEEGLLTGSIGPARPTPWKAWGSWFDALCALLLALLGWKGWKKGLPGA